MQTITGTDISAAARHLMNGELVAIPTETVYGLAGNAFDANAVVKIFEAKNRPAFNPLIVHTGSWENVAALVDKIPAKAHLLARYFVPGPLTFLLTKKDSIPDIVTAGSDKVAVRVPDHPLTLQLLLRLSFPVAAPSANPFGYISPTTAQHVREGLEGKIPYILDGGPSQVGLESTIIGFDEDENVLLYRNGGISAEQIEAVLQEKVLPAKTSPQHHPATAGQLKSHYAPHTDLFLGDVEELMKKMSGKNVAVIRFAEKTSGVAADKQFVLSPTGSLAEAAKNLFTILRKTDQLAVDAIIAEYVPDEGIGRAINDRLRRAQAENKE